MIQANDARSAKVHRLGRTDREIVAGLLDGDPAAARAFVDKYGRSINARVWRMLGADPEHEDVVQQVFVAVLKSISKLKDSEAFRDWIGRITVNTIRNELRSRRLRRIFRLTDVLPEVPSTSADPETRAIERRGWAILYSMSDEDRILFVMRFVEGVNLREIARHTGRSLATVKRRIVKAREIFIKKARRDPDLVSLFWEGSSP